MRFFLQAQECQGPGDEGYVEPDPTDIAAMTDQQRND